MLCYSVDAGTFIPDVIFYQRSKRHTGGAMFSRRFTRLVDKVEHCRQRAAPCHHGIRYSSQYQEESSAHAQVSNLEREKGGDRRHTKSGQRESREWVAEGNDALKDFSILTHGKANRVQIFLHSLRQPAALAMQQSMRVSARWRSCRVLWCLVMSVVNVDRCPWGLHSHRIVRKFQCDV